MTNIDTTVASSNRGLIGADRPPVPGTGSHPTGLLAWLRHLLPAGHPLPDDVWQRRHRGMLALLWLHVLLLPLVGLLTGAEGLHALSEGSVVAIPALLASWPRLDRRLAAGITSVGLFTASAVLVHLSGGYIEMHFHFFVMIAIVALYQHWLPFLVGIGYVVLHHGVMGTLDPDGVYNHPDAIAHPWRWAAIHGAFILAASVAALVNWRLKEEEQDRRLAEQQRASTDGLTGLLNRRGIEERLDRELAAAAAEPAPLAVLLIDLDDLKLLNDRHGHLVGDRALQETAGLLRACTREIDHVGRYGGDEFLVALLGTDAAGAELVVERLRDQVATTTVKAEGCRLPLQLAIGTAVFPRDGASRDALIAAADAAMYAAKWARPGWRQRREASPASPSHGPAERPSVLLTTAEG